MNYPKNKPNMQQVVLFVKHKEEEKVKSKISGMQFAVILGVGGGGGQHHATHLPNLSTA